MRAIGTTSKGTIVYIGDMGAFRSEDDGVSWLHYPEAFAPFDKSEVLNHNVGPKILETPDGRLLAFSHLWMRDLTFPNRLWVWVSEDDGRSWRKEEWPLPEGYHALEAAGMIYDETILLLGRFHDQEKGFDAERGVYSLMQAALPLSCPENGLARVTHIHTSHAVAELTPLCGANKAAALGGFWSQDTGDLFLNPVTKRLEIVVPNRTGGGEGAEDDLTLQTLNLWSMEPEAFLRGESDWRFEATLLQRYTMDVTKQFDGMHPAGSVIDEENGVQHIFIYAGYYHGPAGVFRITRPLDTPVVKAWWESIKQEKSKEEKMKARKYFAALGMAAALTNSAPAELLKDGLILQLNGSSMKMKGSQGYLWADLSGYDHALAVASGSEGSKVDLDGLNGLPVVEFDKSRKNRWQLDAKKAAAFNPGTGGMTFFVVCRPESFDGWQALIRKGNYKESGHEGYNIAAIAGGKGRFVTRAATAEGDKTGVQSAFAGKSSEFSLYVSVLSGRNTEAYLNGEPANLFGPKVEYSGSINPPDSLFVGIDFDGEIAEILIYNRALTQDELNRVSAYLKEKYALFDFPDIYKVD